MQYNKARGIDGENNYDPCMVQIPPLSSYGNMYMFSTWDRTDSATINYRLTIICKSSAVDTLTLNGNDLTGESWSTVHDKPEFKLATLSISLGDYNLKSSMTGPIFNAWIMANSYRHTACTSMRSHYGKTFIVNSYPSINIHINILCMTVILFSNWHLRYTLFTSAVIQCVLYFLLIYRTQSRVVSQSRVGSHIKGRMMN